MRILRVVGWWVITAACRRETPVPATTPEVGVTDAPSAAPSPAITASALPPAPPVTTATFDEDSPGQAPTGFSLARTGPGAMGRWEIKDDESAPSRPRVLAQLDTDKTDGRFALAVLNAPKVKDLELSVRCKPMSGKVDRACGLVFRYRDAQTYYLTRANALENDVRLYHVTKGVRKQLARFATEVKSEQWHELSVEAKGDRLVVSFDGKKAIEATDATLVEPGLVGVWTKADSVTHFDELKVTSLDTNK